MTLLNGVATGTDFTNRIGRKVCWKSVLLQGWIEPQDATVVCTLGRVMVVYDTQPNGALPAITDVLNAATPSAPMNLNNRDRFKIIMDKRVTGGFYNTTATQSTADQTIKEVRKYKKINFDTIYDGTTAAIADVQSGSLFLLTIGSQAAASGYSLICSIRCRFVDA